MTVRAGRTLFLSASARAKNHLWIVVTDPFGDPPQVFLVNFSTHREGADATVVVRPGEHPFIVRDSVVAYGFTRAAHVHQLEALADAGVATFHEDCSDELLAKIQRGLLDSPFTPRWIKGYCRESGLL